MSEIEVRYPTKHQLQQSSGDAKTAWKYRGVVTQRWKLIRWVEHRSWDLYDIRRDPDELTNLSERRRWDAVQARLMKRLDRLWGCVGSDVVRRRFEYMIRTSLVCPLLPPLCARDSSAAR
jgi:arylsulfatase A-like enzyme